METYNQLRTRQRKEYESFLFTPFEKKDLPEAAVKARQEIISRHKNELSRAINDPATGSAFILGAFLDHLKMHENSTDAELLALLDLTAEEASDPEIQSALAEARRKDKEIRQARRIHKGPPLYMPEIEESFKQFLAQKVKP